MDTTLNKSKYPRGLTPALRITCNFLADGDGEGFARLDRDTAEVTESLLFDKAISSNFSMWLSILVSCDMIDL